MSHLTDDQLSALRDGALEGARLEHARRHLAGCAECREALASLESVDASLARALGHDPGDAYFERFAARVADRIEAEDRASAPARRPQGTSGAWSWLLSPRGLRLAGSVAAVLVVAGLAFVQSREHAADLRRPEILSRGQQAESQDEVGAGAKNAPPARHDQAPEARDVGPSPPLASQPRPVDALGNAREPEASRKEAAGNRLEALRSTPIPPPAAPEGGPSSGGSRLDERERRAAPGAMTRVERTGSREEVPVTKTGGLQARLKAAAPAPGGGEMTVPKPQARVMSDRATSPSASPSAQAREKLEAAAPGAGATPLSSAPLSTPSMVPPSNARALSTADAETPVCGRVVDGQGRAVAGAEVAVTDVGHSTTAGPDGRFCLTAPAGEHTVSVLRVGYEPLRETVSAGPASGDMTLSLRSVTALPSPSSGLLGFSKQEPTTGSIPGARWSGGWPLPVLQDVARAQSAAELAARTHSAARFEDAARIWERVLTRVSSPGAQLEARDRIAEARWNAWELDRTPARAASARIAIGSFLALHPGQNKSDQARRRLAGLGRLVSR